jgi:hypothetical protein
VAYYLRAFCTSEELPPLRRVFEWAANAGAKLEVDDDRGQLDDENWRRAGIRYKADKQPLVVEVSRSSSGDELLSEEVEEFVEFLEEVDDSPEKQKVLEHLRDSRAAVVVQLLEEIDDDGYDAVGAFLGFFVEHCGAMIQADGEGFYERNRLLVELE